MQRAQTKHKFRSKKQGGGNGARNPRGRTTYFLHICFVKRASPLRHPARPIDPDLLSPAPQEDYFLSRPPPPLRSAGPRRRLPLRSRRLRHRYCFDPPPAMAMFSSPLGPPSLHWPPPPPPPRIPCSPAPVPCPPPALLQHPFFPPLQAPSLLPQCRLLLLPPSVLLLLPLRGTAAADCPAPSLPRAETRPPSG